MGIKGKIEAVIYAAEEPITLNQIAFLVKEPVLQELAAEKERAEAEALEQAAQEAAEREQNPEAMTDAAPADAAAESSADESPVAETAAPLEESTTPEAAPEAAAAVEPAAGTPADVAQDETATDASETAKAPVTPKRKKNEVPPEVRARVKSLVEEIIADFANNDRGMEISQVAGGYRMTTKPEHHDIVKAFAKSLKPPLRLSLPALETLAVVAYKQPVTAPEVSDIHGVDSQGVMATLLERKLVTTAGRKAVIGRPILYKTTKEFLLRFGLNDVSELPSMEEFEKMAMEQSGLFVSEQESEPTLSPEEAAARLEEASAAEEAASDDGAEDAAASAAENTTAEASPEPETAAPEETHQS